MGVTRLGRFIFFRSACLKANPFLEVMDCDAQPRCSPLCNVGWADSLQVHIILRRAIKSWKGSVVWWDAVFLEEDRACRGLAMYDFEKVLLKPNIEPMDGNTQRIRRNLLASSVIAFFFSFGSQGIDAESSFVGVKFEGLEPAVIQLLLLLALAYFLLHFVWASVDHLKENCLRLTGVAIPMARSVAYVASKHTLEPNTGESRHSTIHSWWQGQREQLRQYDELLTSMRDRAEAGKHEQVVNEVKTRIEELEHQASYISEAMQRYESGFWRYQRSQLVRWMAFDFGVPFGTGVLFSVLMAIDLCSRF